MISIVMTYLSRQDQLNKTLESFLRYDPKEFEVVIVDDGSPDDIVLSDYPFKVNVIKVKDKTWVLGTPAWNIGIAEALKAEPDVIILQNAECKHVGNILDIAKTVDNASYFAFGCYSQGKDLSDVINNKCAAFDGDSAWYNHSKYRPKAYHFCSAITATNMKRLNGFDERFAYGIGYDDDYLLHQIKQLGLTIKIIDSPFVVHQWHYSSQPSPDKDKLVKKNQTLYAELSKKTEYRAKHLITKDFTETKLHENIAYSTHQPLIKVMLKLLNPEFIMELGIGWYSTPIFQKCECEKMFIENDRSWIKEMELSDNVVVHEITVPNQDIPVYNITPEQKQSIIDYYAGLVKTIDPNRRNLLFVDNYSCCRTIAMNTLHPVFDVIIYHDCEPQSRHRNNYYFNEGLKEDFDHYYLETKKTWGGCFVRKTLNITPEEITKEIKPFIKNYEKENNTEGINLIQCKVW